MKSTEQMIDIIDWSGISNKPQLMKKLKELRMQVAAETRKQLMKEFYINKGVLTSHYNALIRHYQNGT